ncbi:putative methylmalonyl-coA epimerase [Desulfosarcina cetonica]|uniref:VOC family protein n=1 Tax=Desulfosarcina cetonica TaxID=90730 RepID=UPI0006D208A7|nr:VOC family protein [Desulfosarcina cetonica]VTR64150.1 putative methylmalonyl-coA epimerase [Desulfosarcina cetonica]
MHIDHIGIATMSLEKSIRQWEDGFGYKQFTEIVENTRQKVYVVFMTKPKSIQIKLIEPTDKSSPIYTFAAKGGGLHHLCFKCNDMNVEIDRFKSLGMRILTPPQPGEAFQGDKIAFIFARNGLNVELIDTDKKAKVISENSEHRTSNVECGDRFVPSIG